MNGYFGKFAIILRNRDRKFVNRIKRLQIDEAQTRLGLQNTTSLAIVSAGVR